MDIRFVTHEEIDKVKWNSCVHFASNGNIFGYKWYLDNVSKEWHGLIEGDYESVMPLVWRKNFWGRKTLYTPPLTRELGVYSVNILSAKRLHNFLQAIPPDFRSGHIDLNEQNQPPPDAGGKRAARTNYQLALTGSYEELKEQYTPDLERGRIGAKLRATNTLKPEKIADFYRQHSSDPAAVKKVAFHAMQRIMYNALHRGWGSGSGILDENEQLLAVNFFLYSHGRAVSLVPVVSAAGRRHKALQLLFDLFIQAGAGRPLILDFNSDDPWYGRFGAMTNAYQRFGLPS